MSVFFYIAGWAWGQYEVNPVFWLATQANKMGISCPPRTLSQATKKCVGQTHKVRYFWKILLMKLQKAAEGSQVLQTQLAFIPSSWNKQAILDCYYSKIFCYIINPSLTNLFLHFCGSPPMVPGHKKGKKELSQYPPILTSCLVNNTYVSTEVDQILWNTLLTKFLYWTGRLQEKQLYIFSLVHTIWFWAKCSWVCLNFMKACLWNKMTTMSWKKWNLTCTA